MEARQTESYFLWAVTGGIGLIGLALIIVGKEATIPDVLGISLWILDGLLLYRGTRVFFWCLWCFLHLPVRNNDVVQASRNFPPKTTGRLGRFRPLYVPRDFVDLEWFWTSGGRKNSYSLLVLDHGEIFLDSFTLKVSLTQATHGIYNSVGRHFVLSLKKQKNVDDAALKIREWLKNPAASVPVPLSGAPLLWAGAGVLPIVKFENNTNDKSNRADKFWLLCRAGTRAPAGLTLPAGGSQDKRERKNLIYPSYREFCEETLLVDNIPSGDRIVNRVEFDFKRVTQASEYDKFRKGLYGERLIEDYLKYRKKEENLTIEDSKTTSLPVELVPTEFRIVVDDGDGVSRPQDDVIFTIIPDDASIDCYQILRFDLQSLTPLYGEMDERGFPQRIPFFLLSLDFLRERYVKNGSSLGRTFSGGVFAGAREFATELGVGCFHIFDTDVKLGRERLSQLRRKAKGTNPLSSVEISELNFLAGKDEGGIHVLETAERILLKESAGQPVIKDDATEAFFLFDGSTARTLETFFERSKFAAVVR